MLKEKNALAATARPFSGQDVCHVNLTVIILGCASSTIIAIDGSLNSASYWSSVIVEAKTIIKGMSHKI